MYKFFGNNLNIFWITEALLVAILLSLFIYLEWLGLSHKSIETLAGVAGLYGLLRAKPKVWVMSGFWIALFWFWWIALSFRYYGFAWAIPLGVLGVGLIYGVIFWVAIALMRFVEKRAKIDTIYLKALFLWGFSYLHPIGFDWLKFELVFINSYFGIQKWQFGLILLAMIVFYQWKKVRWSVPFVLVFALDFSTPSPQTIDKSIKLVTTYVSIDKKWDPLYEEEQLQNVYHAIEEAIDAHYSIVILPESVIPKFINKYEDIKERLKEYSHRIAIVIGGLYLDDEGTPRNSTYIFTHDSIQIANKVVLVPFGESNPLPKFLSDWVNQIFYDGAVDYEASKEITEYQIGNTLYRNAICFEATSERLYENSPKRMIVVSNNGWFTPSTQPTLQKLLLRYYSQKYGTLIYHSINASPSYIIQDGEAYIK